MTPMMSVAAARPLHDRENGKAQLPDERGQLRHAVYPVREPRRLRRVQRPPQVVRRPVHHVAVAPQVVDHLVEPAKRKKVQRTASCTNSTFTGHPGTYHRRGSSSPPRDDETPHTAPEQLARRPSEQRVRRRPARLFAGWSRGGCADPHGWPAQTSQAARRMSGRQPTRGLACGGNPPRKLARSPLVGQHAKRRPSR